MSADTGIGWTDETHNIAGGCDKISAGCKFCYAADLSHISPKVHGTWGPNGARVIHHAWPKTMQAVERKAVRESRIIKVFINSMCDPCEGAHGPNGESRDGVRPEYLPLMDWILDTAAKCPHLILQWLTKRPWNLVKWWKASGRKVWPANLWIGVSVENQEAADTRIPWLLKIPAKVRFLSMEPLLGPVGLGFAPETWNGCPIDWCIIGGESGNKARPMHPDWARSIIRQCEAAGVPVFLKQFGGHIPRSQTTRRHDYHAEQIPDDNGWRVEVPPNAPWGTISADGTWHPETTPFNGHDDDGSGEAILYRVDKDVAGNCLDGQIWEQFPEVETPQAPTLFGVSNVR